MHNSSLVIYEYPKKVLKLKGKVGWVAKWVRVTKGSYTYWIRNSAGLNEYKVVPPSEIPKEITLLLLLME